MEIGELPDLPIDMGTRQEYSQLPSEDIEEHSEYVQRTHEDPVNHIGGRGCEYPAPYPDLFTDIDELEDTEDTDLKADTEERFGEEKPGASLRHRAPESDLFLIEGVRRQILGTSPFPDHKDII